MSFWVGALPKVTPPEWNIAQLMEDSRNIAGDKDHFTLQLGSLNMINDGVTLRFSWSNKSKLQSLT